MYVTWHDVPWLLFYINFFFLHLVMFQPYAKIIRIIFFPSSILTKYPQMTKPRVLEIIAYWFKKKNLKSLWVWLDKLCIPGLQFLPFRCRSSQALSGWMGTSSGQWTIVRCLQRCSNRFKSGLWVGHSKTFTELSLSYSCIILFLCLWSLSCWKVNPLPSLRSWSLWIRFSWRHEGYLCTLSTSPQ